MYGIRQNLVHPNVMAKKALTTLLNTGNKTIAEASPVDKEWGIGLNGRILKRRPV